MKRYHLKIARWTPPACVILPYIGPIDRIPAGWVIVMRRVRT